MLACASALAAIIAGVVVFAVMLGIIALLLDAMNPFKRM
jgi:hypothetical protein